MKNKNSNGVLFDERLIFFFRSFIRGCDNEGLFKVNKLETERRTIRFEYSTNIDCIFCLQYEYLTNETQPHVRFPT